MNGPFGNRFPYTNFHEMNLDWMIQIAKDFLDQYTNIQETIDTGLSDLQEKYDALEVLLQAWYDEHSQDIADQLADALADLNAWYTEHQGYLDQTLQDNIAAFNAAAEQKAQQTIESIPSDYTQLANEVETLRLPLRNVTTWSSGYINASGGASSADHNQWYSEPIPPEIINGIIFDVPADRSIRFCYDGTNPYVRSQPYTNTRINVAIDNTYSVRLVVWPDDIPGSSMTLDEVLSPLNWNYTFFNGLSKQVSDNLDNLNAFSTPLNERVVWTSGYINASGGASAADYNQWYSSVISKKDINGLAIYVPENRSLRFSFEGTNPFVRSRTYRNEIASLPLDNEYDVRITIGVPAVAGNSMTKDAVISAVNWNATFFNGLSYQANLPTITLTVDLNGGADYTDPRQAFDYIYDHEGQYSEAIVYMAEGVYNVRDMFTEAEWEDTDITWRYYWGLTVPPKTRLIGKGLCDNVQLTGYGQGMNNIKAALNFKTSGSIENIHIRSGNLRYAIHDDMAWTDKPFTREVIGCRIVDNGSTYQTAYGAGTNGYGSYKFINTVFESTVSTIAFSMHNGSNQKVPSKFEFVGCTFKTNNQYACVFPSIIGVCDNEVIMIGNKVQSIRFYAYEENANCRFNLSGCGNTPSCVITVQNTTKQLSFADR